MSQNTNQNVLRLTDYPADSTVSEEADAMPLASSPFSVEAYADKLMDELFEDVDRILDRGVKLPTEPVQPEYISLQALSIPKTVLPPVLLPHQQSFLAQPDVDLEELTAIATPDSNFNRQSNKSFDRLLLATACASLLATGMIWFLVQSRWQQAAPVASSVSTAEDLKAQADAQFLEYVQRSLETIDRKAAASRQTVAAAEIPSTNLPAVTVPSGSAQPTGPSTVLERVYVPVYQPPQTLSLPSLTQAPQPAVPAAPTSVNDAPDSRAIATAPNIAPPSATNVLVGVLEFGDRSAALFEINGVAQRINVGESVGSSGWMLVSVAQNGEAIVRRNGEVRSIYVGQQF